MFTFSLPGFDPKAACAFTGHRPKTLRRFPTNLPWMRSALAYVIEQAAERGIRDFISGGALGVDQLSADLVLKLREKRPSVRLIIARPFPSQAAVWPPDQQAAYRRLLDLADHVEDISPDPYTPAKLHIRNIAMVDNSRLLVAVWDGDMQAHSGTRNCVEYAMGRAGGIFQINPAARRAQWLKLPPYLKPGDPAG